MVTLSDTELQRLVRVARDGVYDVSGVCSRYRLDESELRWMIDQSKFPRPILVGGHERWTERELRRYEDSLVGCS